MGGTHTWYKVLLPHNQTGYIASTLVENLEKPLRTERVQRISALLEKPDVSAPYITELQPGTNVPVMADTGTFLYVKTPDGATGWLAKTPLSVD
jgi:hypothetical protein